MKGGRGRKERKKKERKENKQTNKCAFFDAILLLKTYIETTSFNNQGVSRCVHKQNVQMLPLKSRFGDSFTRAQDMGIY